jgi:hypothetical protein
MPKCRIYFLPEAIVYTFIFRDYIISSTNPYPVSWKHGSALESHLKRSVKRSQLKMFLEIDEERKGKKLICKYNILT